MASQNNKRKDGLWPLLINCWRKHSPADVWIGAAIVLAFLVTVEVLMPLGRTGAQAMVMIGVTVFLLASLPWE